MPKKYSPEERLAAFWSKVNKDGPLQPHMESPCWVWAAAQQKGYGVVKHASRVQGAHRVAWMLMCGPIPSQLFVCHRCDTPTCVRPDHLFLGTNADNVADRNAKGRGACGDASGARLHPECLARGERVGRAKLTASGVVEIRSRYAAGETRAALSREFGVCPPAVNNIVCRKSWRHVPDPVSPPDSHTARRNDRETGR